MSDFLRRLAWPWNGRACPECAANVVPPPPLPDCPRETVARCPCGWMGSVDSLRGKKNGPPVAPPGGALPAGSGIVHTVSGTGETWDIPRSGSSRGFLTFGVLWFCFSMVFAVMLWGGPAFGGPGDQPGTGHPAFLWIFRLCQGTLFPLIGIGLIYVGLRAKYAKHLLLLTDQELSLERRSFGWTTRRPLARDGYIRVELKAFYSKNYVPVYGLEARGRHGKIRFGSALDDGDKAWLVQDLRRALGAAGADGLPWRSGLLEVDEHRDGVIYRLQSPPSTLTREGIKSVIFFLMFGAGAQWVLTLDRPHDGASVLIFRILFGIVGVLTVAGSLVAIRVGRRRSRTRTVLEAGRQGLTLETLSPGRSEIREFTREEILRVQPAFTGENKDTRQGEIVTSARAVPFGRDADWADLTTVCEGLKKALALT